MKTSIALMASQSPEMTMSSLEIAELTGKRHDHVMTDIRNMLEELGLATPEFSGVYKAGNKQTYECFKLPKNLTIALVSGYNIKLRLAIIDRWQELENQSKPSMPTTYIAALEALVASEKAKELALLQVDELQVELDESRAYCTIKRFAFYNKLDWRDLSWKKLKAAHIRITGEDVHKIFDANFPDGVNAYHKEAFAEVYPTLEYPDIV